MNEASKAQYQESKKRLEKMLKENCLAQLDLKSRLESAKKRETDLRRVLDMINSTLGGV